MLNPNREKVAFIQLVVKKNKKGSCYSEIFHLCGRREKKTTKTQRKLKIFVFFVSLWFLFTSPPYIFYLLLQTINNPRFASKRTCLFHLFSSFIEISFAEKKPPPDKMCQRGVGIYLLSFQYIFLSDFKVSKLHI